MGDSETGTMCEKCLVVNYMVYCMQVDVRPKLFACCLVIDMHEFFGESKAKRSYKVQQELDKNQRIIDMHVRTDRQVRGFYACMD